MFTGGVAGYTVQGRGGQDVLWRVGSQGQGGQDEERSAGAQQVQVPVPAARQHPRPPRQGGLRSRVRGVRASTGPVRQQRGAAVPDLAGRGGEGGAADEGKYFRYATKYFFVHINYFSLMKLWNGHIRQYSGLGNTHMESVILRWERGRARDNFVLLNFRKVP